jgi:hypothetical protein
VPFTLLAAGLLWFGWFGFNGGSALAANGIAALAFTTTLLAPAATLVVWTLLDWGRLRTPTAVGSVTAIVVGLVAITPAAGFVGPISAIVLGGLAAIPSYFALIWRARTSLEAGRPRHPAARHRRRREHGPRCQPAWRRSLHSVGHGQHKQRERVRIESAVRASTQAPLDVVSKLFRIPDS